MQELYESKLTDGTIGSLVDYLTTMEKTGKIPPHRAHTLKAAITKVFSVVDGSAWQNTDIKNVDVDRYIERFPRIASTSQQISPESLRSYKSRIASALKMYRDFIEEDGFLGYIPHASRVAAHTGTATFSAPSSSVAWNPAALPPSIVRSRRPDEFITYPFPFANGQVARLTLPVRLTKQDAGRLTAFIESIAIHEQKEGTM